MIVSHKNFFLLGVLILFGSFAPIRLSQFKASACKGEIPEGIVSKERKGDKLKIVYAAEDNCCLKFKGKIEFRNDTLYLIRTGSGEPCRCLCKYEYTYIVKGITSDKYIIKYRKE